MTGEAANMMIRLLNALCEEWVEHLTPEEIWKDLEKLELLNDARALVLEHIEAEGIPLKSAGLNPAVEELYRGVFLRETWESQRDEPDQEGTPDQGD